MSSGVTAACDSTVTVLLLSPLLTRKRLRDAVTSSIYLAVVL